MAIIKTYWNFVDAKRDTSLQMFAKPTAIVDQRLVTSGCRGVFFRSVLTEELDFSNVLSELKFEDIRKARNEPDSTLLFKPKCNDEKSIGVLRVMKPRRFVGTSGINTNLSQVNLQSANGRDFDVLLETTEFVLEDIQEQMAERFQLQETFGDFNVFFFGKRAEIFTYSGSLINAKDNLQWRNQFLDNYERFLRGTRCAELKARAYLLYDDVVREGFILGANVSQNSMTEAVVKFSFTLLVTSKRIMGVIPPSRSGTLTLSRKTQNKNGVTDFQFFRKTADDLPSVAQLTSSQDTESPDSEGSSDPSFSFVQNNSLPGDEPPADLKQQMMTRALSALQKINSGEIQSGNDETLDQDILLDFISAANLGSNTKLIISGAKSLDIDNFTGDQLVELLLDGKITVDDLKLKQARDVADSFSREDKNKSRIDGPTAESLDSLSKYFATNSTERISKRVTGPRDLTIQGDSQYVLDAPLDLSLLSSLIITTAPFRNLDEAALKEGIIGKTTFGLLKEMAGSSGQSALIPLMQAYIATFLVVFNPATNALFPEVSSQLHADPSGQPNLYTYIDTLPVENVSNFLRAMTSTATTTLQAALDNIASSSFVSLIASELGALNNSVKFSEGVLASSVNPVTSAPMVGSFNYARFIYEMSVLVTGLIAEMMANAPSRTTVDVIGGSIKKTSVASDYFTSDVNIDLSQGANSETVLMSIGPVSPSDYLVGLPGTGYLVIPFMDSIISDVTAIVSTTFGSNAFKITIDPATKKLADVGYIKLTIDQHQTLKATSKAVFVFRGEKRKTAVLISGQTSMATPGSLGVNPDDIPFPSDQKNSFFNVARLPIQQGHLGPSTFGYSVPTPDSIRQTFAAISQAVSSAATDVPGRITDFLDSSLKNTPSDDSLKKLLALDKYSGVTNVPELTAALTAVGIDVTLVSELFQYAKAEVFMASNLERLKTRIADAVSQASNDPENKAAAVAKNNEAFTKSICG